MLDCAMGPFCVCLFYAHITCSIAPLSLGNRCLYQIVIFSFVVMVQAMQVVTYHGFVCAGYFSMFCISHFLTSALAYDFCSRCIIKFQYLSFPPHQNRPTIYRSRTVFEDATPEMVRDFFWDDEFRTKWDPMLTYFKILDECPHTGTMIVHWIKKVCRTRRYLNIFGV